jgi:DtxR family Mn-dependent transcriptional regulator
MTRTSQYLLALYIAEHRLTPPIPPGEIAEMLDRSPASVTEMLNRLDRDGLVSYESYEGATLTDAGREQAEQFHQSYVALSWFFRDVLGLDAHEQEAMEMAGMVSPVVAERIVSVLSEEFEPEREIDTE